MRDASFEYAVDLVDQTARMPVGDASRYIFDRYRTSSPETRDEIVLALIAALSTTRQRASTGAAA